jgi:hypothetical protein
VKGIGGKQADQNCPGDNGKPVAKDLRQGSDSIATDSLSSNLPSLGYSPPVAFIDQLSYSTEHSILLGGRLEWMNIVRNQS